MITWALIAAVLSAGVFVVGAETSFATSDRSSAYCDDYARDYANRNTNSGGDVLGSALGGAAYGSDLRRNHRWWQGSRNGRGDWWWSWRAGW